MKIFIYLSLIVISFMLLNCNNVQDGSQLEFECGQLAMVQQQQCLKNGGTDTKCSQEYGDVYFLCLALRGKSSKK